MACSPSSLDKLGTLGKCRKPRKVQGGDKEFYSLLSTSPEPSKAKVIVAPVCPSGKTAKDMTCHCSKEPAGQGIDGNSRGGCVSSPNQERQRAHGWCFLENISNPGNGTENCFEDTKWSVVDGRFWSNMACIDEYRKKEEERIKPGLQLLDKHTPPELLLVDAPAPVKLQPSDEYKTGGGLLDIHIPLDLQPLEAPAPKLQPLQPKIKKELQPLDEYKIKTGGGLLAAPKTVGGLLAAPTQSGLQLLDELQKKEEINLEQILEEYKGAGFDSNGCMSGYNWDGRYCADKRDKYCGHIPFEDDSRICSLAAPPQSGLQLDLDELQKKEEEKNNQLFEELKNIPNPDPLYGMVQE